MTGKTALGSLLAGLALLIATRSSNSIVQAAAATTGAGLLGYTVTTLLIDSHRQHKSRLADADVYLEFLRQMNQERQSEQPPAACQGCCHYHGQTYGGQRLICAMHPYGVEDITCPDWQSETF